MIRLLPVLLAGVLTAGDAAAQAPSLNRAVSTAPNHVPAIPRPDQDAAAAEKLLTSCGGELKTAILVARLGIDAEDARQRLVAADGRLRLALGDDG